MVTRRISSATVRAPGHAKGPTDSSRRPSSDATRTRILDAAEELFAFLGYDATSIRDVADKAGVRLALVTYHTGVKEALFDQVVARRASAMAELRNAFLDAALARTRGAPLSIEEIVTGYVHPFVERSSHGGSGWKHYAQLVARLANSPRWGVVISKHYDEVARRYLREMHRALPDLDDLEIHHRFSFMVGTMLAIVAEPERVERLSDQRISANDLEDIFASMLPFLAAGFRAPGRQKKPKPRERRSGKRMKSA